MPCRQEHSKTLPDIDGETLVDAEGLPGVSPCVRFAAGVQADNLDPGKRLTVEGRIRTRVIPGRIIGSERFEAVFEIEVRTHRMSGPKTSNPSRLLKDVNENWHR